MHPHTKQQLESLIKTLEMPNDVLAKEELENLRSFKEANRNLEISASINPEYYRKTKIIGLFQQALLSQAEMIRAEMNRIVDKQINIHKELSDQIYLKQGEENHHLEYVRLSYLLIEEINTNLDELINSFK